MIKSFINKFLILIVLLILSTNLIAQEESELKKIQNLYSGKNYIKSISVCNEILINNENKVDVARLHFFKSLSSIKLYENTKQNSYLDSSYISLNNALKYDRYKEITPQILEILVDVASKYVYKGVEEFNNSNYKDALVSFEKTIAINTMPAIMQLDTIILYNAALAAEKLEDYDRAIKYYKDLINYNFGGEQLYLDLAGIYKLTGDTVNYLAILARGEQQFYQDHSTITTEYINYYLQTRNYNKALIYLNKAVVGSPYSASIYYVLGSVYEELNDKRNAIKSYENAIFVDSTYSDALYNLSAIYYNKGIKLRKAAQDKNELEESDELFRKSLYLLEKAELQEPKNNDILTLLRSIYKILKMEDKAKAVHLRILYLK